MRLSTTFRMTGLLAWLCVSLGYAYGQQPNGTASAIPSAQLLQPEELVQILRSGGEKPLVFQVGPHVMFAEAHVPGSEYVGPGRETAGLAALRDRVKTVSHDQVIVLYCGCCPWTKCPNVQPAYEQLRSAGFGHVKVLYLATNFGADWVSKGFPVEKSR